MSLSPVQLAALQADVLADPVLAAQPNNSDGNAAVAAAYNLPASPAWVVWKKSVPVLQVGDAFNGSELAGLSSLNHTRLLTVVTLSTHGVNPSLADRRQFFADIFSGAGGATTRANLDALWRRNATRAEKLFSAGTGSTASPATTAANVGEAFTLTAADVDAARNLP